MLMMPANPPTTPIPASVVLYEGLRVVPHLFAEVIVGMLMYNHTLDAPSGMLSLLAILAGQLYPRPRPSPGVSS